MKHTPGPWGRNIPPATKYPTVFAGRNTHVAYVKTDLPPEEVEANAQLIAAAPDLLEVAKTAARTLRFHLVVASPWGASLVDQIEAAILKAEGQANG